MSVKGNLKLLAILAVIAAIIWFVAFPRPRLMPDGSPGNFSLVQMYGMQFADGRIENLYAAEQDELNTSLQTESGGCRSGTKMKAIGARLSGDAQQITTLQPMGYPRKANKYAAYAAKMAAKAKAFQALAENCEQ